MDWLESKICFIDILERPANNFLFVLRNLWFCFIYESYAMTKFCRLDKKFKFLFYDTSLFDHIE